MIREHAKALFLLLSVPYGEEFLADLLNVSELSLADLIFLKNSLTAATTPDGIQLRTFVVGELHDRTSGISWSAEISDGQASSGEAAADSDGPGDDQRQS